MKHCKDCRFVEPAGKGKLTALDQEIDIGLCHKNPPVVGPQALPFVAIDHNWCGALKPRRWWHR